MKIPKILSTTLCVLMLLNPVLGYAADEDITEEGLFNTKITCNVDATYTVKIPKAISFVPYSSEYTLVFSGSIPGDKKLELRPTDDFGGLDSSNYFSGEKLKLYYVENGRTSNNDVTVSIEQSNCCFSSDEVTDSETTCSGRIFAESNKFKAAGDYVGCLSFLVKLTDDPYYTPPSVSIPIDCPVSGLYNGETLLATMSSIISDNGFSLSESSNNFSEIITNHYPTATKLILGPEIKKIKTAAFAGCNTLTSVEAYGLTEMGYSIFSSCTNLASVVLKGNYSIIPNGCFYNCTNLTDVTLSNSTKVINPEAFRDCTYLHITIPDSVLEISSRAFSSVPEVIYNDTILTDNGSHWGAVSSTVKGSGE